MKLVKLRLDQSDHNQVVEDRSCLGSSSSFLDLDGIPQNVEIDPVWKDNPSYTILSASKRLRPLELYDKNTINLILQRYVNALTKDSTNPKLLQDIGIITAYLQQLH